MAVVRATTGELIRGEHPFTLHTQTTPSPCIGPPVRTRPARGCPLTPTSPGYLTTLHRIATASTRPLGPRPVTRSGTSLQADEGDWDGWVVERRRASGN
jgi:hypothetical protein